MASAIPKENKIARGAFFSGFLIHMHSDSVLNNLRKNGSAGYRIPDRGLFSLVSCPNYLGEMIQWTGWALATWSLPGLCFCIWTVANLAPRALSHHRWYKKTFKNYPENRKAVIPFLI